MKNNKGFSLVELLVAIAVAGIVTTGIASLMMQSLSMYSKETVNAKLQTDLQTASNYLFDSVMESKGFIIINDTANTTVEPTNTRFALLGDFSSEGGAYKVKNGYLYIADSDLQAGNNGSIYLSEYSYPHSGSTGASLDAIAKDINDHYAKMNNGTEGVLGKEENVLVNNVTKFLLKPTDGVLSGIDDADATNKSFTNPISIDVQITFEKQSNFGKVISKNIEETIDMRNTIKSNVYYSTLSLNPDDTYHLYTTAKLNKIKTDVNKEMMLAKNPGEISIQSGGGAKTGAINILEIMPDESYDYIQYIIGGKNGECLIGTPDENGTGYGGTVSYRDFEAYMCLQGGTDYNANNVSGYFLNNNAPDLEAIVFTETNVDGYYEYVGENQGSYAIHSYEEESDELQLLNEDDHSGEYYVPEEVSDGDMEYQKETDWDFYPANGNGYSFKITHYEYVGKGNGNVNLKFVKQGWYKDGYSYRPKYPENNTVKNVVMYSKYYTGWPSYSQDYGFVWHESDHHEKTLVSDVKGGFSVGDKIYVKGHRRWKIVNNEIFRLFVMQNLMEKCLPSGYSKLNITKGVWDTTTNGYCTPNHEAVENWNKVTANKIELNPKVGKDVTIDDVENADLIIIGAPGDGGFNFAHSTYWAINKEPSKMYNPVSYSSSNDISFDVARAIYKKVLSETAAIACPTAVVDGNAKLNISKMAFMLYGIKDYTVSLSNSSERNDKEKEDKIADGKDYWSDDLGYQSNMPYTVNGSGRRMYEKYIDDMPANNETELNKYFYLVSNGFDYNGQRNNSDSQYQVEGTYTKIEPHCMIYGKKYDEDSSFKYVYKGAGLNDGDSFGIYRNQLMWQNTSDILHFNKTGESGLLGIQSIFKATQDEDSVDIPIGNIYVEGACATGHERTFGINATANSRGSAVDTEWYETNAVIYESNAVIINEGTDDERAIIYLNEQEYEVARTQGLDIYCVVKSKEVCDKDDTYVYQNESHKQKASDFQDYKNGTLTNETHIREFKYHLSASDLDGIAVGSKKDYVAYAKIAASEGIADGEAKFSIVVRDLFNLN